MYDTDREAKLNFFKLFLYGVRDGEINLLFVLICDVAWLFLGGYANC